MKTDKAPTEATPLWQLAEEQKRADAEPIEPSFSDDFRKVTDLMTQHPNFMRSYDMEGQKIEIAPKVSYLFLKEKTIGLPEGTTVPDARIAEVHRIAGTTEPLYLLLASNTSDFKRQFTVQEGAVSDVEDTSRVLSETELREIEDALIVIAEAIESDVETLKRRSLLRKIGAYFIAPKEIPGMTASGAEVARIEQKDSERAERAERRAYARERRKIRREIRRNSLGEVGTDV